jgi:tRNA uridine 5-carbamoylmethylation protein Kti12
METSTRSDDRLPSSSETTAVILFGGLPASGKSTMARKIKDYFHDTRRVVHLEYDALEDQIASEQQEKDDIAAWNEARLTAVQQLEGILKTPPNAALLILMDDNFHLRGMRKKIHRLLLNYRPIRFGVIWMETDLDVCLQRNGLRERRIPHDVLLKMKLNLESPRSNWERNWISVSDDTAFKSILSFVQDCEEIQDLPDDTTIDPRQQERDRLKTLENQRHLWDKLLRTWVGQVAKHDKTLARGANAARKEMLVRIKEPSLEIVTDADLLRSFVESIVASTNVTRDNFDNELSILLQQ